MKKRNIPLLIIAIFILSFSQNFNIFIQADIDVASITQHHTTTYSLINGSYVSGINNMAALGGGNATFIETLSVVGADITDYNFVCDNKTEWHSTLGITNASISNDTFNTLSGTAINFTFSVSVGEGIIHYDNGTSDTMGLDLAGIISLNFSLRSNSAQVAINKIDVHNTATKYWTVSIYTFLSTVWQNYTMLEGDWVSYGGITHSDPINYFSLHFAPKNTKIVWIDLFNMIGEKSGDIHREISGVFTFSGLPSRDYYALNLSVARSLYDTLYDDDFATETTFGWTSNDTNHLTIANGTDVYEGSGAVQFLWDGTTNCTATFDNGTTNNMTLDWSDFNAFEYHLWGNCSLFSFANTTFHTDTENYFYIDVARNVTTDKTVHYKLPFAFFNAHGSPSWSNISYINIDFNTKTSCSQSNSSIDDFRVAIGDDIAFSMVGNTVETWNVVSHMGEFQNTTITLDSTLTQSVKETGVLTVMFNDTYHSHDVYNNSVYVDLLRVTSWNDIAQSGSGGILDVDAPDYILDVIVIFSFPILLAFAVMITILVVFACIVLSKGVDRYRKW